MLTGAAVEVAVVGNVEFEIGKVGREVVGLQIGKQVALLNGIFSLCYIYVFLRNSETRECWPDLAAQFFAGRYQGVERTRVI